MRGAVLLGEASGADLGELLRARVADPLEKTAHHGREQLLAERVLHRDGERAIVIAFPVTGHDHCKSDDVFARNHGDHPAIHHGHQGVEPVQRIAPVRDAKFSFAVLHRFTDCSQDLLFHFHGEPPLLKNLIIIKHIKIVSILRIWYSGSN